MPFRILIIEDDRLSQQLYADHLNSAGFTVETADSGEDGLGLLEKNGFDILIIDMILPGINGLEVLSKARTIDPDIGILIVSALDVVDPAVRAIKAGAFDYIVKPFDPQTLLLSAQRCLEYKALLAENNDLKRHLALSQAGARIAAEKDPERLYSQAAEALTLHMWAALTIIATTSDNGPVVEAAMGSAPSLQPETVNTFSSYLTIKEGAITLIEDLPEAVRNMGTPFQLGITGLDRSLLVLAFPGQNSTFCEEAQRAGQFLARHLTHAVESLDKLEAAQHLAYIDDVTQLFNCRYLHRVLDRLMDDARSNPQMFAVLFLDLDRFKQVNDTHGHLIGSELLVEVAAVLKSCIRDGDIAFRYGGDEYVAILPKADQGTALKVAERIRRKLEERNFLRGSGKTIRLTASVGVACCPEHTTDKRRLIELADHAMYRGKRGSRNVVYMATPDKESI